MYGPEWTGAYNDADPVWATITASSKTSVGYVNNINDGVFFMTVTDFKAQFSWVNYTLNPKAWKHSYWMALGDGDTIGVPGTTTNCGATCKKTVFEITSTISQTLHISASVRSKTQYYEEPCLQATKGKLHVA